MPESMDISELAFAIEDFLRPFAGEAERFGELAEQLNDLSDMVVVFAVLCAGLWIEQVVAGYELEDLDLSEAIPTNTGDVLTIAAILQTSVLAPHLAPRMTSGERYCLVWMSFVKWWPTQQAFPRSAIFTEMTSSARSSLLFESCEDLFSSDTPARSFSRGSLRKG